MSRFLHVGCGHKRKRETVEAFAAADWEEVTLDIVSPIGVHLGRKPSMRLGNPTKQARTENELRELAKFYLTPV